MSLLPAVLMTELAPGTALVPIMTGAGAQAGAKSMGKTDRGTAAGAAIGALASGLRKDQAVTVPPGTLLEFQLQQPVNVNVAR